MDLEMDAQAVEQFQGLLDEFKSEFFKDKLATIKHIYIDIEALQDFRLGALLCLISTSVEYEYIQHVLKLEDSPYIGRLNDRTMDYFPAIKDISDSDIDEFINDKRNHKALVRISPMTMLYTEFFEILVSIVEKNVSLNPKNDPGATIHIGTNSVTYDSDDMFNLASSIVKFDPRFRVEIYNKPLHAIGRDFSTYQMLYINNIKEFLENPNHSPIFQESSPLFDCHLFGYPLLEQDTGTKKGDLTLIANTDFLFSSYTNFHYIPRGIGL